MFQDEDPDKISQPCRDDEVNGLAHENARRGEYDTDTVIQAKKDPVVPPSAQPPCSKTDDDRHSQVDGNNVLECSEQIIPDPVEHVDDDPDRYQAGDQDCTNLSIHESATRDAGWMIPSRIYPSSGRLFLSLRASGWEIL